MKKILKVTQGKRFLSLVLAVVMMATVFNMALPVLKLDASAAGTIDGVTQERIVGTDGSYAAKYENYAANFLNGASNPTNIVIPGLNEAQDYVIQGMTYYPERDWMLVTAYHNADTDNGETVQSSKVFALDAATGEFVAMFSFLNPDGTANTEHGGGIACSENNIYYACGDDDRQIAYAPISAFKNAAEDTHTVVQLVDMVEFNEIGSVTSSNKTAYTAYVCYDDGILWTGNFYDMGVKIAGISVAATDYSVPANSDYNSMVFGYRLVENVGSTQEERSANEWNYLMGNVNGKDCRGNPSYVIGLNNSVKDVQYAVVDNGKLYLSCSFGTGEGTNSVSLGGMNPYSTLAVADIDLTQPGTKSTTINTHNGSKTVKAYDIQNIQNFDMMPMSEGLCVIEDKIYITFESASNKYLKEAGTLTGNCNHPIDVIWELDPYALMETTVTEPEKSIYYEKVYNCSQIKDGDEYIIVHESKTKDPVSQKPYLYALNAEGNFKGLELSKSSADIISGYDGMIGHPISYYSFDTIKNEDGEDVDILYLDYPEDDDVAKIRWTITKNGDGDKYSIKNTSTYFANYNSLYFDSSRITMMPNNAGQLSNIFIGQLENDSGYFYLSNNGQYYLWCNDGFENYNTKYNAYYANNAASYPLLDGVTEVAGTFHCDALNLSGANNLGGAINTSDDDPNIQYEDGAFQIYRRVVDDVSSTYESRVYTNLASELQADGTYTVTFDTYAISPNHYQYVGERPTDYIIVADTSYSMSNTGSTGISAYGGSDTLSVNSLSQEADTSDDKGKGVVGYGFYQPGEDVYFKHTDGKYYKAYMAITNYTEMSFIAGRRQFYFVYYIADDGLYYCVVDHAFETDGNGNRKGITYSEFKARVDNAISNYDNGIAVNYSDYSTQGNNSDRMKEDVYRGEHYRFDNTTSSYAGEHKSIDALKNTTKDLITQIADENSENRIALVKYGENAQYFGSNGWASSGYTDAFLNAKSNASNIQAQIDSITASVQTSNDGLELNVAKSIIDNSGVNYEAGGDRNVAVIFLSDGIPGKETPSTDCDGNITGVSMDKNDATTAANNVITTAHTIKNSGAFIYTVLFGANSAGNFSKKTYMDAVSSKYPAATAMDELGGQSVDGVNYAHNIATCSIDNFVNFGSHTCEEVAINNAVGLDNLNADSYLREVLSDAFIFPENDDDYSIETQFVPGEYDEIGRFAFGTPYTTTEVTTNIDTTTKTITVTGYDYSTQYISKGNDKGKALRVVITGLLLNSDITITNKEVSISGKTGIYKNLKKMNADDEFKGATRDNVNVSEYTYVLDYGVNLYDSDVNGTMLALDNGLNAQPKDAEGKIIYRNATDGDLIEMTNSNQDLIYKMTPTSTGDKGYVLIQRPDGEYDWFKLNVVPASNVYYEETTFDVTNGSNPDWTAETNGTSLTYRDVPGEGDVDGFDNAYDNSNKYSNGTILSTTVDKSNKRSDTASVTFKGNGFDLVSACGPNTGVQLVAIKQNGTTIKSYIVDTYYDGELISDSNPLVSQVPIVNWRTDTYGEYTVETKGYYLSNAGALRTSGIKNNLIDTGLVMNSADLEASIDVEKILAEEGIDTENVEVIWFDDNSILNGGTGAKATKKAARDGSTVTSLKTYVDGFRIYNPLGTDSSDYAEGEKNASYVNVIENLAPVSDVLNGIGFISGTLEDGVNLSFSNYQTVGPQSEFYLKATQAITFKVKVNPGDKVMLGLRAVNGATTINVSSSNSTQTVNNIAINSATEMFYDISNCIGAVTADNTEVQITVQNGAGILALNQVKFSGGAKVNTNNPAVRSLARSGEATQEYSNIFLPLTAEDLVEVENTFAAKEAVDGIVKNGVVIPLVEEENEIPDNNTTPDVPGDDTNNDNNDDTNTDSGEKEEFSIFSLLELLISLIEKILHSAFGTGNLL